MTANSKRTRKIAIALSSIRLDLLLGKLAQLYTISAIYALRNGRYLVFNGSLEVVKEFKVGGSLARGDGGLRECFRACTTLCPMIANDSSISSGSQCFRPDEFKLSWCIRPVE